MNAAPSDGDRDGHGKSASGPDQPPLILGAQLAAAQAADARHQAAEAEAAASAARPGPREPNPLAGISYDLPPEELGLLHFRLTRPDEQLDQFAERFASGTADQRARLRSILTIDDFYTLLFYARRAVVRALRSRDVQVAARAVSVLAAVDTDRVDGRDLIWQAGLLAYAVRQVGGEVIEVFEKAASLACDQTAEVLREVAGRPPGRLRQWGFREVQTADGIGLIEDDGSRFKARADLVAIAERIAAQIAASPAGRWQLSEPVIGAQLQPVWLRAAGYPEPEPELDQAFKEITGCVLVRGGVEAAGSALEAQHLLMYLAETKTVEAAEIIARAAGPGSGTWFAGFGVAAGPLCAVLIARSVIAEVAPVETQPSLERFRPVLAAALGDALL
ncbi:MAG TPA: hypothetical protein VFI65_16150 [Streptosporangiaceae bacterium]|nr:hypothetical protein [Streptosporangiaceae bacterium]